MSCRRFIQHAAWFIAGELAMARLFERVCDVCVFICFCEMQDVCCTFISTINWTQYTLHAHIYSHTLCWTVCTRSVRAHTSQIKTRMLDVAGCTPARTWHASRCDTEHTENHKTIEPHSDHQRVYVRVCVQCMSFRFLLIQQFYFFTTFNSQIHIIWIWNDFSFLFSLLRREDSGTEQQ